MKMKMKMDRMDRVIIGQIRGTVKKEMWSFEKRHCIKIYFSPRQEFEINQLLLSR